MQLIHQNQEKIIEKIFLNQKEKRFNLMKPSKKKTLKSKTKEIKEILYDQILDTDEKIE